ncbi:MAG: hypothetical protein Q8Q51_13885 [Lutibacter sp.]|nr:hypothetical protein [Lutibacter sp.]
MNSIEICFNRKVRKEKYTRSAKKILDLRLMIDEFYLVDIFNFKTNRKSVILSGAEGRKSIRVRECSENPF